MIRNQKGWVYVDALIAMVVLASAIVALALNFHQSTIGTISVSTQTQAAYLAHQVLTELKVNDGKGLGRTSQAWIKEGFSTDTKFQYNTEVLDDAEIPDGIDANIIPVRVTVQWIEPSGNKSLQIVTYYYK